MSDPTTPIEATPTESTEPIETPTDAATDRPAEPAPVRELEAEVERLREQLAASERRRRIDQLLVEGEAIDLEAARLLTESALAQMDEADVDAAVEELKRRKPYLFRRRRTASGAMAAHPRPEAPLDESAAEAAASGDRRDLLRYLRLRRRQRPA